MATITRYVNPNSTAGGDGTTNATAGANRAYVSLNAWEAAQQQNLDTGNNIAECICETGGTADATAVIIDGWTTAVADYIIIKTSSGHRHDGKWNTAKYRLEANAAFTALVEVNEPYVRFEGLQFRNTGASGQEITFNAGNCLVDSCVARGSEQVFRCYTGSTGTTFRNTIAYGATESAFHVAFDETVTWDNCTGIGGTYGFNDGNGTSTARNCYARGTTTAFNGVGTITTSGASDTTGTAGLDSIAYTTTNFVNVTANSEDLHLVAGTALINAGTDLSGTFTVDIDGVTRSGTWDVGADEYVAPGGGGTRIKDMLGLGIVPWKR